MTEPFLFLIDFVLIFYYILIEFLFQVTNEFSRVQPPAKSVSIAVFCFNIRDIIQGIEVFMQSDVSQETVRIEIYTQRINFNFTYRLLFCIHLLDGNRCILCCPIVFCVMKVV